MEIKRRKVEKCMLEDEKDERLRYEEKDERLRYEEKTREDEQEVQVEKARADEDAQSKLAEISKLGEMDRSLKYRDMLRTEQKYFSQRMLDELKNITDKVRWFPDDLERQSSNVRELIRNHSELFAKIENGFGEDFEHDFGDIFASQRIC